MKILYGIQATGNGHISRSREVIKALKKIGHEVHSLFSGRKKEDLQELEDFEPWSAFRGLTFVTKNGKICNFRTALQLDFIRLIKDIRDFNFRAYDLVITDYEPITAHGARHYRIPSIGIGHQYSFNYDIPSGKFSPLKFLLLKYFAPARYPIGLHWNSFNQPILPPIVPSFIGSKITFLENKILVYLPFENFDRIKYFFKDFKDHDFYFYGNSSIPHDEDNLHSRPFSRKLFLEDLLSCGGVVCNAGFELPSEALHLGKKLLVKPVTGQIEQESNACTIEELKLGNAFYSFDKNQFKKWFTTSPPPPQNYPDVPALLASWITRGKWHDTAEPLKTAWNY